jgi:nucleotide-binding universal stress UspA family protein
MFHKILVPLDLTERHQPALNHAAALAKQSNGELVLLHVIETIAGIGLEEERAFFDRLKNAAQEHLDRQGSLLSKQKVSWKAEVRFGHRAAEITRCAAELNADLIVLTSPRFRPENPLAGWSSVSHKVSMFAQCPVLLVK